MTTSDNHNWPRLSYELYDPEEVKKTEFKKLPPTEGFGPSSFQESYRYPRMMAETYSREDHKTPLFEAAALVVTNIEGSSHTVSATNIGKLVDAASEQFTKLATYLLLSPRTDGVELYHRSAEELALDPNRPPLENGLFAPDARFVTFIKPIDTDKGDARAPKLKERAAERLKEYHDGKTSPVHLFALWTPYDCSKLAHDEHRKVDLRKVSPNEHDVVVEVLFSPTDLVVPYSAKQVPVFVRNVLRLLWKNVVKPQIEREEERRNTPVRVATPVSLAWAHGRAHGGQRVDNSIIVEPPSGVTLCLPFDADMQVAHKKYTDMVGLRSVLRPGSFRNWLASICAYQDNGARPDGSFELHGEGQILDIIGTPKRLENRGTGTIARYHSKELKAVREDFRDIFPQIRVRQAGNLVATTGDPLVDEIKDRRSGRVVTYAHARLVVHMLHNDYLQIPRAVCKLPVNLIGPAMGAATIVRQRVLAFLKNGRPIEAPIATWLEASGTDIADGARKHGQRFWDDQADMIAKAADDGGVGQISKAGNGKDMILTLSLSPNLSRAYRPILDAAKSKAKAKTIANIQEARARRS